MTAKRAFRGVVVFGISGPMAWSLWSLTLGCALALSLIGCGGSEGQLRARAAVDLDCKSDLTLTRIDSLTQVAEGCQRRAVYIESCRNRNTCTWVLNSEVNASGSAPSAPSPSRSETPPDSSEIPEEAVGFRFGMTQEEARAACETAGHLWSTEGGRGKCSGLPVEVGLRAQANAKFCDTRLCGLTVSGEVTEDSGTAFLAIWSALREKYGVPREKRTVLPSSCRDQFVRCVLDGQAEFRAKWVWKDGSKLEAELKPEGEAAALVIRYRVRVVSAATTAF